MSYTGTNTKCQLSIESVWGTNPGTGDTLVSIQSEGLKYSIETKNEETVVGSKTATAMDIMGVAVDGDLSLYARPETVGYLLALGMGTEVTPTVTSGGTNAYDHVFTLLPSEAGSVLPSTTIVIDRKAAVKAYVGCKISSLNLSASAKDYLQLKASFKGKAEETGTIDSNLSVATKKAFRFVDGSVKINGSLVSYVTSFDLSINNNLDDGAPVLGSGIYGTETDVQQREVSITLETFYDADTESIRENYFKTGDTISTELTFQSIEEAETGIPYTITISIPNIVISDASPNISGKDKITMSIVGTGIEVGAVEPITITVIDLKSDKYI